MGKSVNKFIVRLGDSSQFRPKPTLSVKPVKEKKDCYLITILHPNAMLNDAEGKPQPNLNRVIRQEEIKAKDLSEAMKIGNEILQLPEIQSVYTEWHQQIIPPKPRKGKMKLKTKEEAENEAETDGDLLDSNFEFADTADFNSEGEKQPEAVKEIKAGIKEAKAGKFVSKKKIKTLLETKTKVVKSKNKDKNKKKKQLSPKKTVKAVSKNKKKKSNNKKQKGR